MSLRDKSKRLLAIGIIGCMLYVGGDFLFAATGKGQTTESIGLARGNETTESYPSLVKGNMSTDRCLFAITRSGTYQRFACSSGTCQPVLRVAGSREHIYKLEFVS